MVTYYRVQPRGLPLAGHSSENWAGEVEPGRVCAYDSPSALLCGEHDDWGERRGLEVVEFRGRAPRELGPHVPGLTVAPGRILRRTPLRAWLSVARKLE